VFSPTRWSTQTLVGVTRTKTQWAPLFLVAGSSAPLIASFTVSFQ
jgi:hypothetical protein